MNFRNASILLLIVFSGSAFGQTSNKINLTFFGSSVCNGSNAESKHGYAWQFFHTNTIDTTKYQYFNVSTGGDNLNNYAQSLSELIINNRIEIILNPVSF